MNNAMAWPLQQNHRGFDEDLPRSILPGASAGAGAYPSCVLFGSPSTGTSSYYNSRSLANAGANCRTSQQMLTAGVVDDAGGDGGGGPFSDCVEPQPQRPPSERFGRAGTGQVQENGGAENLETGGGGEISAGGGGGGGGNGCFMPDPVLTTMMGSSPSYSPHIDGHQHHVGKRGDTHNHSQGRSALSGMWPSSQGHFNDDWGALLGRPSTPTSQPQQMPPGFSAPSWPPMHNMADKQWNSQPRLANYGRQAHMHLHQQPMDKASRRDAQEAVHDQHLKNDMMLQPYGGYLPPPQQQQQQQPRHLANGWASTRPGLSRPLSPQNTSPAVLYSAAKNNLPSLLGGGNGSIRLPPLPDSDPTDGGSDGVGDKGDRRAADGKIQNNDGFDSQAPSAQSNHDGLQMLVAAHNTTGQRSSASSHQQYTPPSDVIASMYSSSAATAAACLSPRDAIEMNSLRPSAVHSAQATQAALAAANAVAMDSGDRGSSSTQDEAASGGGVTKASIRSPSGVQGDGRRPSKLLRTAESKREEERDAGGCGGGVKADGTGGGGAAKTSTSRRRPSEESLRDLTPEERLKLNRERNRDHSRRSRERKKAYVEGLKKQVSELGAYRMLVEEAHDLISAHSTDVNAVFTFASGGFDRLLGMDPTELLGVSFLELVDPNDSQEVLRSVLATLRRGGIRQVQYRMRPPAGAHAAEVETSFRLVSTRLVAVTRVRGRSPSPCDPLPPPSSALPSLSITSAPGSSHVPPPSPLLVQPLPPVSGIRVDGGAGGLSLPADFSGEW